MRAIAIALALLVACKADRPAGSSPGSASGASPSPPPPSPRAGRDAPEALASLVPSLDGATSLGSTPHGDTHVIASWCIAGGDAVEQIKTALAREGWTEIATRGSGERVSISATKPGVRLSARTGGTDRRCTGTLVTTTVLRLGAAVEIEPGERLR